MDTPRVVGRLKGFFARHHQKLWWLHSLYALGLGIFVATFAQKGLVYVRWLFLLGVAAWFVMVAVFRVAGSGKARRLETTGAKVRFFLMTYVLKNLFQGMLFFLLPFYWKTATFGASSGWFVVLLGACTLLATLDVIFDQILMRWRLLGALYLGVALFACLNLAIPTLMRTPAEGGLLLAAAGATLGSWTLHFQWARLRQPAMLLTLIFTMGLAVTGAWMARALVPPVPLMLTHAAVGPEALSDGRLALEVTRVHQLWVNRLMGVTDVQTLASSGEAFVHVWRRDGTEILRIRPSAVGLSRDRVRLRSTLEREQLPIQRAGQWSLDVETTAGQLVGRHQFVVMR